MAVNTYICTDSVVWEEAGKGIYKGRETEKENERESKSCHNVYHEI